MLDTLEMNDLEATREFLIETREGLDQLDREFVALEADPSARERITTVFRTIHTIKGTSGFLGLSRLEKLAHVGENLLVLLREGTLTLTPPIATALLAMVDRVRAILEAIETRGDEGDRDDSELMAVLTALKVPNATVTIDVAADTHLGSSAPSDIAPSAQPVHVTEPEPTIETPVSPAPTAVQAVAAPTPATPEHTSVAEPIPVAAPSQAAAANPTPGQPSSDSNVRVDVGLLDNLMDLVGELVLSRNQIMQVGARLENSAFASAAQRLDLITTELQGQVMKTRMQPIGTVWAKLPRVIRDLAVTCGKQVRVEMAGKETELDRTILEAVKDPLTHIVRNAIDHGIETPKARAARGKARTGTLSLRAFHAGGQVNIEVSDDGNGLDLEAIRAKALERGLVTRDQATHATEYELAQLVFLPGFSTAKAVTNVSGRGVGMDVVKTNIEKIGGSVEILSKPNHGTTIKVRIPLTLAIVPALIVAQSGQRYAIPQANLVELVRLDAAQLKTAIEIIHGVPVYRLRGQLLPIVELAGVLRTADTRGERREEQQIIVVQAEDRLFGLLIDEVRDTEEIVVKPLGKELKGLPVFAGAAIMGDGRVALILDIQDLARHAGVARERADRARTEHKNGAAAWEDKQTLLLSTIRGGVTIAVPLASVARLEEIPARQIESSGSECVVMHRGRILPLIDLADLSTISPDETVPVIVYADGERTIGLIVQRILDVVAETVTVERVGARYDAAGTAIIQGKITDLVDLAALVRSRAPWFYEGSVA